MIDGETSLLDVVRNFPSALSVTKKAAVLCIAFSSTSHSIRNPYLFVQTSFVEVADGSAHEKR